jgi:hypothetical protein
MLFDNSEYVVDGTSCAFEIILTLDMDDGIESIDEEISFDDDDVDTHAKLREKDSDDQREKENEYQHHLAFEYMKNVV